MSRLGPLARRRRPSGPRRPRPSVARRIRGVQVALLGALVLFASAAAADPVADPADDRHWLALLHQARHRLSSAAAASLTDSGFYLHPRGARRPELELEATVAAMTDADPNRAQRARCRFPARHAFLAERGLVPSERGACPELEEWRATIAPVRATIVFPEAFLGNPSSMFGHTLLRFDRAGADDASGHDLLSWTLDYTADPGDDGGPLYLLRGLAGGYLGRFGIAPYYVKTRVYSDWQDRDIWEYPLSMSPSEIDEVLLHVWELREVELPYAFFTRNCSDYLLDVLEIGWPGLGRGGGFPPAVTPIDTLRAMEARAPGSVGTPRLRPSPATELQHALAELGPRDAALAEALAAGRVAADAPALNARSEPDRARLLEVAYDLAYHQSTARSIPTPEDRERMGRLLRARSRLPAAARVEPARPATDRKDPLQGHRTARAAVAAGVDEGEAFVEWRLQPALHESIDAPDGFAEGGEIRFLDTRLRYYPEHGRVRLQEFSLLDVSTASPWRPPFRPIAWHTEIGLRTRRFSDDDGSGLEPESLFRLQGGVGAASAPARRLNLYAFAEAVVEAGAAIEGNASAGPLLRAGLTWSTPGGAATTHAEVVAGALLSRDPSAWLRAELSERVSITHDWSLSIGGSVDRAYGVTAVEGRASLIRYF